jgi:uncharacterized protein (TIGR02284 family)
MADSNTYSTLNELLETCRDGQNGFDTAAKAVDDPALKAELMQYSMQRQDFAAELRAAIAALGDRPNDGGSVSAAMHRGWINLKSMVGMSDRHSILAECERGEDSAVKAYREAIQQGLPPVAGQIVQTQYEQVQRVHDRVRALRDASKAAAA